MSFPIKMTLGEQSWDFTGDDAKGLSEVSGKVKRDAEEMEAGGAEGETIVLPMDGMKFDASVVDAAVACMKASAWVMTVPKVVTSNDLSKLSLGAPSVELLQKYSATELHGLFSFAEYLECNVLRTMCLVKLAAIAFVDPSVETGHTDAQTRCNLGGMGYDMNVEKQTLAAYPTI